MKGLYSNNKIIVCLKFTVVGSIEYKYVRIYLMTQSQNGMYCLNQRLEQPALTKEQQGICTYNCIYRPQQPAYTKEQQSKIMYNVRSNCILSYLHHCNQGPDVGKFKSKFPSDFHS